MSAPHGTYARYANRANGCRCEECRDAKADYMRDRRARARRTAVEAGTESLRPGSSSTWADGAIRYIAPDIKHGTRFGYEEAGCRCFDCTEARTVDDRNRRHRKRDTPATPATPATCAGCGNPLEPDTPRPYICARCEDEDNQPPARGMRDVPDDIRLVRTLRMGGM